MKKLIIILILLISVRLLADQNDKLHIGCEYVLTFTGYTLTKAFVVDDVFWDSIIGGAFALSIGVYKEYNDAGKSFDWEEKHWHDIKCDLIGISLGLATMWLLEPFEIILDKNEVGINITWRL